MIQHTYFLTKDDALAEYAKAQSVEYPHGQTLRQFCYYHSDHNAPVVEVETPYLVNLPAGLFFDFFKFFLAYPIPAQIVLHKGLEPELAKQTQTDLMAMLAEAQQLRQSLIKDALFTQPVMARWMAIQAHALYDLHPSVAARQVCYYLGDAEADEQAPSNLIGLKEDNIIEDAVRQDKRLPQILVTSPFDNEQLIAQGEQLLAFIQKEVPLKALQYYREALQIGQNETRDFSNTPPYRIFISSSRYTTVMRYAYKYMAKAFEDLGHEVLLVMDDDLSVLTGNKVLSAYTDFKPHVTFNINHVHNNYLAPEVFNVVWWQDAMDDLVSGSAFNIKRERDFFYAFGDVQIDWLHKHKVEALYQEQCFYSEEFFPPKEDAQRRNVIVFVGSAYYDDFVRFKKTYGETTFKVVEEKFLALFNQDTALLADKVNEVIESFPDMNTLHLSRLWIYLNRREIIYKLIDESPIPLELYGYEWEKDAKMVPFFKGTIKTGKPLADLYRSVKYGLSIQPYMIGHQRLAEMKACGAIPITKNTPNQYEQIDYWDEIITFNTGDELIKKLKSNPTVVNNHIIENHFSYIEFAKRILQRIEAELGKEKGKEKGKDSAKP